MAATQDSVIFTSVETDRQTDTTGTQQQGKGRLYHTCEGVT